MGVGEPAVLLGLGSEPARRPSGASPATAPAPPHRSTRLCERGSSARKSPPTKGGTWLVTSCVLTLPRLGRRSRRAVSRRPRVVPVTSHRWLARLASEAMTVRTRCSGGCWSGCRAASAGAPHAAHARRLPATTASPGWRPRRRSSCCSSCRRSCSGSSAGSATSAGGSVPTPSRGSVGRDPRRMPSQFLTEASINELLVPTVQDVLDAWAPRARLGRLPAVAVGGLAGPQRLHRHRVDHVRAEGRPRHHPPARASACRSTRVGTLAGDRPAAARAARAEHHRGPGCRRSSTSCATSTGRPSSSFSVLALTSLYHVSTPRRAPVGARHPGRGAGHGHLALRLLRRADLARGLARRVDDLRPAQRADRAAHLALRPCDRHPHRRGPQRRHPHPLAGRAERRRQQRRALAPVERAGASCR